MDIKADHRTRLGQLERQLSDTRDTLAAMYSRRSPNTTPPDEIFLAITCADPSQIPDYPAKPANVFPVALLPTASFPRIAGLQSAAYSINRADGAPDGFAFNMTGGYLEKGTPVIVSIVHGQWWITQTVSPEAPVRFRLTASLALGGEAAAQLLTWGGAAWALGETITVCDWLNTTPQALRTGMFRGIAGYEGWAVLRVKSESPGTPGKYDVVWMEHKAESVFFTLTAEITGTNTATAASYANDGFARGRDPNLSANTINVYDRTGTFLHAPIGAKGLANYDDRSDRYEIVECQLPIILAEGTLDAINCGVDGTITLTKQFVQGRFCLSHGDEQIAQVAFLNPRSRRGVSGTKGIVAYDLSTKTWTLLDVGRSLVLLTGLSSLTDGKLVQEVYNVAVETCSPVSQHIIADLTYCGGGTGSGG